MAKTLHCLLTYRACFLLSSLLFISTAQAQFSFNAAILVDAPKFQFGPRAGLQYSSVVAHDNITPFTYRSNNKPIVSAGAFVYQRFGGIYIQGDALFTTTNVNVSLSQGQNASSDIQFRTTNLDLPVVAGIGLGRIAKLHGGLIFTQLISASYSDQFIQKADIEQNLTKSTLGYVIGIGFSVKKLVFDIRYNAAITGLKDGLTISRQSLENANHKNRMITLSVGYDLLNNRYKF